MEVCKNDQDHETKGSQRNMHIIVIAKRAIAIRAFPRSRRKSFFHAIFAENVPAGLYSSVLEVPAAYRTKSERLQSS